jgi:hypothetical protein
MGRRKRHHLVSRGYLKAWTDRDGRISYIDKVTQSVKLIGTKDAFVAPKFLTLDRGDGPSDELETAFGRVEQAALPLLRMWGSGADSPEHQAAVKAVIALHFARSDAIRRVYPSLWDETVAEYADDAESDEELIAAFIDEHDRQPRSGELHGMLLTYSDGMADSNVLLPDSIERLYGQALDHFGGLHIQRAVVTNPRRGELVVADSPVVLSVEGGASSRTPTPLMQADQLWFPVSPTVGASLATTRIANVDLDDQAVWRLNNLSWDHSHRFLAARPGSKINRSFGFPGKGIRLSP